MLTERTINPEDYGVSPQKDHHSRAPSVCDMHMLKTRYPARNSILNSIVSLMGEPTDPAPPSIFIYGHSSLGKTSIVKDIFTTIYPASLFTFVNCVECYTPRLLLERVLNGMAGVTPGIHNDFRGFAKCDNINMFVVQLTELVAELEKNPIYEYKGWTRYIIFDRAERLRDMPPTMLPALLKLSEVTGLNICTLFITSLVWEKFRGRNGCYEPLLLRFPEYTNKEVLEIIMRDYPLAVKSIAIPESRLAQSRSDDDIDESEDEENLLGIDQNFFRTFAEIIYNVFYPSCRDLNELRHVIALVFPKYCEPVIRGEVQPQETSKLVKLVEEYMKAALNKIYLREISSAELLKYSGTKPSGSSSNAYNVNEALNIAAKTDHFALPYYTKYLLIASFLASYNPPRLDVRYFAKGGAAEKRKFTRKGKGRGVSESVTGGKNRQQLRGPKAFPIERMLAIFYSIIEEPIESTIDAQMQISTLVTLRLLARTTAYDKLDSTKCKCNVNYDFVKRVSMSVKFDVDRYLYDFV